MGKEILIEYADMKEEIKDLRRRIDEREKKIDRLEKELEKLNESVASDSVTKGKKGKKPLGMVIVRGTPRKAIERKRGLMNEEIRLLRKNKLALEQCEIELLELTNQVEKYIEEIERSELRTMFRLYYMDNLTWEMVAMRMNYMFPGRKIAYTKDSCRMRHDRFYEKR